MSAKGSFDGLDWIALRCKGFFRKLEESDCLSPITPLLHSKVDMPDEVLDIVGDHHERQDGREYPKGIKGNLIYDLAKIVSIANFFDHKV